MLAVASSLQQIYEKVFRQDHRGMRDLSRLLTWIVVLGIAVVTESLTERPVSSVPGGGWLAPLVTVAIMTPFFWWTMHFLVAGRVPWRTLLPSAVITGIFYGGPGDLALWLRDEEAALSVGDLPHTVWLALLPGVVADLSHSSGFCSAGEGLAGRSGC
jgi:hypothetical protein